VTADLEVLQIFREEAGERLDRIVDSLLSIESGQAPPGVIDSLFRDAHSIKGNAGMVGFGEVREIAHAMEDLLDQARDSGELPQTLVEPLLRGADAIRRGVEGATGVAAEAIESLSLATPAPGASPVQRDNGDGSDSPARPARDRNGAHAREERPESPSAAPERRSMRVATDKVDRLLDVVGEAVLHHRRLEHLADERAGGHESMHEELDRGDALLDALQDSVIRIRTLPLSSITGPFPRAVRDLGIQQGKEVELSIKGTETQLDRVILDGVSETITHLLRNAVSHGIETPEERELAEKPRRGLIQLSAEQRGGMVAIEVADDGRGVPGDLLERARASGSLTDVLAAPGFSTAGEVTELSGRGVGLDAVKSHVESLGGSVEVTSETGAGTRVVLLLPLTLALMHVLLVERGGQPYAIPLASVQEAVTISRQTSLVGRPSVVIRDDPLPCNDLADLIGASAPDLGERSPAVVVASSQHKAAVTCDGLIGEQEVVTKSLGLLAGVPGYLGGAILGDGRIALVLDPAFLARGHGRGRSAASPAPAKAKAARVLVVDDQFTVRELQRSILETAGYDVATARDGREALETIDGDTEVGLVVTDIQMPGMDGFALLESIRGDERRCSLPVVVVTSMGDDEHRHRGAELGADAYIVKEDFDQQALLETVSRLVGR
jgi:two-component system chemotaxis sensor kinase CheA